MQRFLWNWMYMTLAHCMWQDWFWISVLVWCSSLVVLLYWLVAWTSYSEYKRIWPDSTRVAWTFVSLTLVFAFCAIAWYASVVLALFIPVYRIKALIMIPLVISTIRLIYRLRQGDTIAKIIKMEDTIKDLVLQSKK